MVALAVMSCSVFAGGIVAASDATTALAHPQMDPLHPQGEAILTASDVGGNLAEANRI